MGRLLLLLLLAVQLGLTERVHAFTSVLPGANRVGGLSGQVCKTGDQPLAVFECDLSSSPTEASPETSKMASLRCRSHRCHTKPLMGRTGGKSSEAR
jgi:hypothetical protein